jgi:hypothetical protein
MPGIVFVRRYIMDVLRRVVMKRRVGQMLSLPACAHLQTLQRSRPRVSCWVPALASQLRIPLQSKTHQTLVVKVHPQGREACDRDIEPQVRLQAIDEQRSLNVGLDNRVLALFLRDLAVVAHQPDTPASRCDAGLDARRRTHTHARTQAPPNISSVREGTCLSASDIQAAAWAVAIDNCKWC